MKKILLANLLAAVSILLGVSPASALDLAPYFNFGGHEILVFEEYDNPGTGWVYDETFAQVRLSIGTGMTGLLELEAPTLTPDDLEIYQKQTDGHHYLGFLDFGDGDWELLSPAPGPVDGQMSVGQTLSLSFTRLGSGGSPIAMKVDYTLTKAGFSYTTPAGTFNDCVQIDIKLSSGGAVVSTDQWILAKGVGHVYRLSQEPGGAERATLIKVF